MVGLVGRCNSRPELFLSPVSSLGKLRSTERHHSLATTGGLNSTSNAGLNTFNGGLNNSSGGGLHHSASDTVLTPSSCMTKGTRVEQPRSMFRKTAHHMFHEEGRLDTFSKMLGDENAPGRTPASNVVEMKCIRDDLEQCKSAHAQTQEELNQTRAQLRRTRAELRNRNAEFSKLQAAQAEIDSADMQGEIERLKSELHNKIWSLRRVEGEREKEAHGYKEFIERLSASSATPVLTTVLDLSTLEMLGMGKYGYAMACTDQKSKEQVVVKLQSLRWTDVAVKEWTHGLEVSEHRHIVRSKELFLHRDENEELQKRLVSCFESGSFSRQCPRRFPGTYICMVLEYMDSGTLQSHMDSEAVTLESIAAVTRQVASALAFMHSKKKTHNDIKPENVLLKSSADGQHLVVKLADFGLAAHSVCRKRDSDLSAYTIWCMGTGKTFLQCPREETREDAVAEFRRRRRKSQASSPETAVADALADVVAGLWGGALSMMEVEERPEFQNCQVRRIVRNST